MDLLIAADPGAEALVDVAGTTVDYAGLTDQVATLAGQLAALGIGPGDRVAIVLPNGLPMAAAFLAVAVTASAAPLNPLYRESELAFYLGDLDVAACITDPTTAEAVRTASPSSALQLQLIRSDAGFRFVVDGQPVRSGSARFGAVTDEALVLHTSGTTSRPKMVSLTQANLLASVRNVADTLQLAPTDRCLNVMPLFHIHGLVAALLATLGTGGSVVCTGGFDAFKYFDWVGRLRPTWSTAVPTVYQMIAARLERGAEVPESHGLRFLRSSSAPLPPSLQLEIERRVGVPLVEAYGMTEAAHQIACNPLPPGVRRPGSVGKPTGAEVRVVDEDGQDVPTGVIGEVAVRGENVTSGYAANQEANAAAFFDGWFRTGDEGRFEDDGYLVLTGRIKEIINRGGEKISPREIDEALLDHPAVASAVAFAIPHKWLGETVGAAIVLEEGASTEARELRLHVSDRLAPFKLPEQIVFVSEIPKGPTGKLQRIGLAERLGIGAG
ncbi:MAG: acyl--CoA ligase [Acidimicrobiia bacterium]